MDIKVKDKIFKLTDDGINFDGYNLILKLDGPDMSLDDVEDIFNDNKKSIKVLDGDKEINAICGYTDLIMVSKDYSNNIITVTLMQPVLIIKGAGVEQVKRLIIKEGYEVDG